MWVVDTAGDPCAVPDEFIALAEEPERLKGPAGQDRSVAPMRATSVIGESLRVGRVAPVATSSSRQALDSIREPAELKNARRSSPACTCR